MNRSELRVEPADAGQRLDAFVAGRTPGLSRSQVGRLIAAGTIRVDGAVRKASYAVRAGDGVTVEADPSATAPSTVAAEELAIEVLYEDDVITVVNKAPGMVVHPAPGRRSGTLVNALLHRWGMAPVEDVRPGIVHRLDRDTSGVMVVARNAAAREHLGRQFHDRTVRKRYLAVVRGVIAQETLHIDAPVGRHPVDRKKMSTHSRRGRVARTTVRVLERFPTATFVEAAPETGRTHQIRVHLAAEGFPIAGDAVYGGGQRGLAPAMGRQALHAAELTIEHPTLGDRRTFAAPLWADMDELLATLRKPAQSS